MIELITIRHKCKNCGQFADRVVSGRAMYDMYEYDVRSRHSYSSPSIYDNLTTPPVTWEGELCTDCVTTRDGALKSRKGLFSRA